MVIHSSSGGYSPMFEFVAWFPIDNFRNQVLPEQIEHFMVRSELTSSVCLPSSSFSVFSQMISSLSTSFPSPIPPHPAIFPFPSPVFAYSILRLQCYLLQLGGGMSSELLEESRNRKPPLLPWRMSRFGLEPSVPGILFLIALVYGVSSLLWAPTYDVM